MLDLEAARVADLALGKREGADAAIAIEAESTFQVGASGVRGTAFVVGDGNLFSRIDGTDCMNGFALGIAVPAIVGIGETAVIDEANGRIDAANLGVGTAGQSVGFDDSAERVFAREIVMKRKKLALLVLG